MGSEVNERVYRFEDWANLTDLSWPLDGKYDSTGGTNSSCLARFGEEDGPSSGKQIESMETKSKNRRNRISEKVAVLHDLIPNARKRDMASKLDDAVKYMKSLQLQLQFVLLASVTMRICDTPINFSYVALRLSIFCGGFHDNLN
ncbi:transcription factor ALC-like [Nymphaea colorata]|nr:transcription factor ALC-like [Nymphaea colorata]